MEEIPQSFNGLFHAIMAKLKEEREKRRRVEDALEALKADFTNYQRDIIKRHDFLSSQVDTVMKTHAANADKRLSTLEEAMVWAQNDIALLKSPGKTNNNMKG